MNSSNSTLLTAENANAVPVSSGINPQHSSFSASVVAFITNTESTESSSQLVPTEQGEEETSEEEDSGMPTPLPTGEMADDASSPYDEQEEPSDAAGAEKEAASPYDEPEEESTPTRPKAVTLPMPRKKKAYFRGLSSRSRFKYLHE